MRFLCGLITFLGISASCWAQSSLVLPPDAKVEGKTQAEWSRAWWQWAGAFEEAESPVGDRTGEMCHLKQSGSVWFLAGTYGSQRTIRNCTIPKGRYVFFPLINYVVMPGEAGRTCQSMTNTARSITDDPSVLVLDINGTRIVQLERHRQASPGCFDMGALATPKVRIFPSAANGYYVMLAPPAPGKYVLNFGGILPSLVQAVTYNLVVE